MNKKYLYTINMAERVQNAAFNNIKLMPNGTPKHGDGLLYIGENPLLVYSDGSDGSGGAGWFLNQGGISQASGSSKPISGTIPGTNDPVVPGSGLRLGVYPIESLNILATSDVKTDLERNTNTFEKQAPKRHEQYSNMGMFVQLQNSSGNKQILTKGDVVFAVDDLLFNNDDLNMITNYIIGWNEVNNDVDVVPLLLYTGDNNSKNINYKYYDSKNKTVFDLKCDDSYCNTFNEDGYGTMKKPCTLTVAEKSIIVTKIKNTSVSTVIDRLINKPLTVKMNSLQPSELNFTFDYTQYEYNAGMVIRVKFNSLDVLDKGDILFATDVNDNMRGLSIVNDDRKAFLMVYSNSLTEADMNLTLVKMKDNGPYSKNMIYNLSPDANFSFINDEYREFDINVGRANQFLGIGWTWFSNYLSNVESKDDSTVRSIVDILTNKGKRPEVLDSISQIKTQGSFAKRDEDGNWIGTLDILSNTHTLESYRSYKLFLTNDTTWIYDAYPLTENIPLNLSEQWNWIGYPYKSSKPVSQVLSSTILQNADYMKGQTKFSTITDGVLDLPFNMERTKGYKIYMNNPVANEMFNIVDEVLSGGSNIPQVPEAAVYTFSKVTKNSTYDITSIFGAGASWKINNDNSALFTLANGEDITVTGDVRNWIYTNNDDFNMFDSPFVKIIDGKSRKLAGMCVKQAGYIITGTTVSDVKLTVDFNVLFEDESGDTDKNTYMSLSKLGVGPIVFSDSNIVITDKIIEPVVFTVSSDDRIEIHDQNQDTISSIQAVYDTVAPSNFKENRREKVFSDNWSLWYPTSQIADQNKELVFTYFKDDIYYEQVHLLSNVIIKTSSGEYDIDELNMNSIILGNLWAIRPANGALMFYHRNSISEKYTTQQLSLELSLFNPRNDGILEIKDESDRILAIITPITDEDDGNIDGDDLILFDGETYGNIDYEERKLGVSDWSIWYPNTTDINNTYDENDEIIIPEDEDKELVFTYKNYIQTLTIPTVTSPDRDSLNEKSMILGHLWAIEPKSGGLTFYFRESTVELYEAQTDIQSARYLTNITKVRFISRVTV